MRRTLLSGQSTAPPSSRVLGQSWVLLAPLCCQAAGGDLYDAVNTSAAWTMLYTAAHIMDSVEDVETVDNLSTGSQFGEGINVATGLYISSSLALVNHYQGFSTNSKAIPAMQDWYQGVLSVCSGQHRDLTLNEVSLERVWAIAHEKSGAFFSLACRAGAAVGSLDPQIVSSYSRYGIHLGVMVQIADDVEDIWGPSRKNTASSPEFFRSIATAYALSVASIKDKTQLREYSKSASHDASAADEARGMIRKSGAGLYLAASSERHRTLAEDALKEARALDPARGTLLSFINEAVVTYAF